MTPYALWNGRPVEDDRLLSTGSLLGLTCFETIAVREGRPQLVGEHLARLAGSASSLGLEPLGGFDALEGTVQHAVAQAGIEDGVCRASLHGRGVPRGLAVPSLECDVLVLVTRPRYGRELDDGGAAVTATTLAPDPRSWPAHVKAPCLPRTLAYREAESESAFEALMLDGEGHVISGSRSNVFAVVEGVLVTPPAPPALPGIQRSRVLGARRGACTVRAIARSELDHASELFVTLTGPCVVPLTSLDGNLVGDGTPGPTTRECIDAVRELSPTGAADR